ncbi:MAG: hypothetical protein K2N60_01245 [Oscillospiraceae bacterium]|nr:hypothetical protein [Oscillospiraceae bacterium]
MVEIKYINSNAGIENGFELSFNFKKYIPEKYWQGHLFDMEKSFLFDLMEKSDLFTCDREGFDWFGIWHHRCSYKEIKFTLSECDGICSFFVEPWDIAHLSEIAEALKNLIIKTKE